MGEFEPAFLDLPPEVIRATIRANQKCFVLREAPASYPSWPALTPAIHGAPEGASSASVRGAERRGWPGQARP